MVITTNTQGSDGKTILGELNDSLPAEHIHTDGTTLEASLQDRSIIHGSTRPLAVVTPSTVEEVSQVLRIANKHGVTVVTRGAASGLNGGAVPLAANSIVVSTSKLDRILDIDPINRTIRVQAGVITARINQEVNPYGLFYAPDPASSAISSIGGNIATNAGGFHCVKYGVTGDSVLSLTVVLADGSVITTGSGTIKDVAGLDLTSLFVGSEGELGIVVDALLRLHPKPADTASVVAFFEHIGDVGDGIVALAKSGVQPSVCELLSVPDYIRQSQTLKELSEGASWMVFAQTDGLGAALEAEQLRKALANDNGRVTVVDADTADWLLKSRSKSRPLPDGLWFVFDDAAVPLTNLTTFFGQVERIAGKYGFKYEIVAHIGDGNLHVTFVASKAAYPEYPQALIQANEELLREALKLGGTITGEHGIGAELKYVLPSQIGKRSLSLQKGIKQVFDPNNILNTGKWL